MDVNTLSIESPHIIEVKGKHRRIRTEYFKRMGKRLSGGFTADNGEIPVMRINPITRRVEEVENKRGNAYGLRNAKRFRNKLRAGKVARRAR